MSSSLPYSVVTTQNKVLPFLKVVGDLDVSGNLTVDGNTKLNGFLTVVDGLILDPSCGIYNLVQTTSAGGNPGNPLISQGGGFSPIWALDTFIFAPIVFYGRLATNLAMTDGLRTNLTNITSDVINVGGTNLNSTTGRFTCPATGVYNLFLSMCFVFTGNNGSEATANLQIYNSGGVLQREYLAQNYFPTNLLASTTSMININYTLTAGFYVVPIGFTRDATVPATVASTDATYFGGSRIY